MSSDFRKTLKKVWWFIWKDDSILSWIVNIILAFVLVKFVIYPGIGLLLGTTHPVVAVVSGSMEHDGNFDEWWDIQKEWYTQRGISKEKFLEYSFKNGFNKGDIMFLKGINIKDAETGDVIVFKGNLRDPVIHRIVKKYQEQDITYVQTKGDHNSDSNLGLQEDKIGEERIIGKAFFRIPFLGWVKIVAVDFVNLLRR